MPDEWVDNPGLLTSDERRARLDAYRNDLLAAWQGRRPESPVLRAFADTLCETGIDIAEPLCFLDAMAMDLTIDRYPTYADLERYMRGSAAAVGLMMLPVLGVPESPEVRRAAMALGEAMQMTNFLRDVGEDARRGRIYLPLEDLKRFGVSEAQILAGAIDEGFVALMRYEIERARVLYLEADSGIPAIPGPMRSAVLLARELYARILDRIERRGYDVFSGRARTTRSEKVFAACRLAAARLARR